MNIPIEYISHSRLETFRKNPSQYKRQYIEKSFSYDSTPAMALGSLAHAMLLEPATVDERFCVAPIVDKRTKAGKEKWDEFQESLKGSDRIAITHDDVDICGRMIAAIHDNPSSSYFLNSPEARREEEILIPIAFDGMDINFKFIPDLYCPQNEFLLDLKTTASYDPMDWAKDCVYNGYIRQMALYRFLLRYMHHSIKRCIHIVVDKGEFPSCMICEIDSADVDRAEAQVMEGVRKVVEAHASGIFLPSYYGIVPKVTAPSWAWRQQ